MTLAKLYMIYTDSKSFVSECDKIFYKMDEILKKSFIMINSGVHA